LASRERDALGVRELKKGFVLSAALLTLPVFATGQQSGVPATPQAATQASNTQNPSARITLDEAIRMALLHNHALQALRSTIQQSEAEEITANLRPNPTLGLDTQYLPIFQPSKFSSDYLDQQSEFDAGIGYLFERGKKRQHRLQAARDLTTVVRSQVSDSERQLTYNVAQQFVDVLLAQSTIDLAVQDLDSFQKTVNISNERYRVGDMSEGDFLKIKLQLLQFQTDLSAARLAKVQALAGLRQLLGFESVPDDRLDWGGEYSELLDAKAQLLVIGPLAVSLIFLILFALYGNFKFPITIALGVVITEPVGALIALKLTHTLFSVSSVLGLLALLGVSVESAVILVSYINKLRLEGRNIRRATLEASLLRLRPIMMTALVACLGLLPAAMSTGVGSDTQKPFAIVVVAGLLSRLFLGFFVNPVLYEIVAREGDVLQV
jgi:hypothetical protein